MKYRKPQNYGLLNRVYDGSTKYNRQVGSAGCECPFPAFIG